MLKKLLIEAFSDQSMETPVGRCQMQMHPENSPHSLETAFSKDTRVDTHNVGLKFKTPTPQEVGFEFLIDATSAADTPKVESVYDEVDKFGRIAYGYQGQSHSWNYLRLSWGSRRFNCMLTSLEIEYLLFTTAGVPLRARLSVKFRRHLTPKEIAERARMESTGCTSLRDRQRR